MWQYQRPGFRGLLLAELQRQQRGSQFCDIVLRADGVSVPAHSCVLSALSPQLSCTLPSTPPPNGQRHLVEFGAVRASTLLRLVSLLYSGEVVGQGEEEREDILSATARLGISGLVEVRESGEDRSGRRAVGIQTEPVMLEEGTQCSIERGTGSQTQMGELLTDATHLTPQPASGAPDPHHNIPYVPLSMFYPPDGTQTLAHHPSYSDYIAPTEEPTAGGHGPFFIVPPSYSSLIPTCHTPAVVYDHVTEVLSQESGGEGFEQFEGNIPGFINHFLNPGEAECSRGRRRARRRGGGARGARQTRTGEGKAERPRAGTRRRGRPPKQQTAAAAAGEEKEAAKSIPLKSWLRGWGVKARRSGRGGGAVGRMLYLHTRDHFQPIKLCLKKRGRGKSWKICSEREEPSGETGGAAAPQLIQEGALAQKTPPTVSLNSMLPQNSNALLNLNPPTELSSSQRLPIPRAPFLPPAPEMLHTTPLPSLEPPSHVEHAQQFDRLLEEVMMGLDILDKNNNSKSTQDSHPHPFTHPATGTDSAVIQHECQHRSIPTALQETASGVHDNPMETVTVATGIGGFVPGSHEVPVLQLQQGEGGLSDILDNFLLSFEQKVSHCSTGARVEKDGQTCTQAGDDASTTSSSSQPQPCTAGRDRSIAGQSHTHAASTIYPSHLENTHSPHPVQAVMSPMHPQNQGTYTPPLISSKLPPVSAAKHTSSDANRRRRGRPRIRDRKVSPEQAEQPSVARPAKPINRENACSEVQPVSAAGAVASSVSAMHVPPIPPKADNGVRKPEVKLVIKKKHRRPKGEGNGDHNEQAKRPHSLQPIIRIPKLFSGQCVDLKSTVTPPVQNQIKTYLKAYPIRSRLSNQQEKHVVKTGEPPLPAKQPTSSPQVVRPIVIKKLKNGIHTVQLKTERDRKDRLGQEIDLPPVDKPVPAISSGQPHPVEYSDVDEQMEERRDEQKEQGRATSPEEGSQAPERKGDKRQRESEEEAEVTSTFQTKPIASIQEPHADSQDVMALSIEDLVVSEEEGAVEVLNRSDCDNIDHPQGALASEDERVTMQQGEEASESINLKMKESSQKVEKHMRETREEELQGPERRGDKRQRESEEELATKAAKWKRLEQAEQTVSEPGTIQSKPETPVLISHSGFNGVVEVSSDRKDRLGQEIDPLPVDKPVPAISAGRPHPVELSDVGEQMEERRDEQKEQGRATSPEEGSQAPERKVDKRQRESEEELTTSVEQDEETSTFQTKPKTSILEPHADSQDVMAVSSEELFVTMANEEEGAVEVLNRSDCDNNDHPQDALACDDEQATTQVVVQLGEEASESINIKMRESSQKVEKNMRETSEEELQGPERRGDKRPRESEEDVGTKAAKRKMVEQAELTVLEPGTIRSKPEDFLRSYSGFKDVVRVSSEELVMTLKSEEEVDVDVEVLNSSDTDNNDHNYTLASEDGQATAQRSGQREEAASEWTNFKISSQKVVKNVGDTSEEELKGTSSDEYINIIDSDTNTDVVEENDVCLKCCYTDLHNTPNRTRKTPVDFHSVFAQKAFCLCTKSPPESHIPLPPLVKKVELVSTGSRDDEEEDDVDIIGWSSPLPNLRPATPPPEQVISQAPLTTKVDLGSTGSREDVEDEEEEEWEVDIIGFTSPFPNPQPIKCEKTDVEMDNVQNISLLSSPL